MVGFFFFLREKRFDMTVVDWRGNFLLLREITPVRLQCKKEPRYCPRGTCSLGMRILRTRTYFDPGACACRWQLTMAETVFRSPSAFHRELEGQDTLLVCVEVLRTSI